MNFCYDCNSSYERPGTCNCFAPGGKRAAAAPPATFVPPTDASPLWHGTVTLPLRLPENIKVSQ